MRVSAKAIIVKDDAIVLIEYNDATGLHYNFPGGTVEEGESLETALHRELLEEIEAQVRVEHLAFVYEYIPELCNNRYGDKPGLSFLFQCQLLENQVPKMPGNPDPHQTGVKWIPLKELGNIVLLPNLGQRVRDQKDPGTLSYTREHELAPYDFYPQS